MRHCQKTHFDVLCGMTMAWLTTQPNPRSPATGHDAGQRGWKLHAVKASPTTKLSSLRLHPSLCGLVPSHGWGLDTFIEDRCRRCTAAVERLSAGATR
jgi:hypothetical protein